MNARFSQAQEAYDNRLPPEYYEDPTALEKAHQRALDDFMNDGYLCIASPHQLGCPVAGRTRNYYASDALDDEGSAYLLTALVQAPESQRKAIAEYLAVGCMEHAQRWISQNVNEKYGAES